MVDKFKRTNKFVRLLIFVSAICVVITIIFFSNILDKSPNKFFFEFDLKYTVPSRINNCTVIVRGPLGRLGNVLFEFASAYGLSLDYSCRLYIGAGFIQDLSQYFEINLPNLLAEVEVNWISPRKQIYSHCTYYPDLFQPNNSGTIELSGYWQSYRHFINHTDQIRHQLRFKQTVLNQAMNFTKQTIHSNISNLVGIHIRRGDFIGQRNVSSDKFILDAMAYFTRKYGSVNFILVSDDKSYCRKVFGKRNDSFVTPDSFTPAEDMAVLSICNHSIITVGTFGWWGAFLLHNKTGEVISDSKPDHSALDVDCARSVFFPPWFQFLNRTE